MAYVSPVLSVGPGYICLPQVPTTRTRGGSNNPNDHCAICMAETTPNPPLGPHDNTCSLSLDPIFMEKVTFTLRKVPV